MNRLIALAAFAFLTSQAFSENIILTSLSGSVFVKNKEVSGYIPAKAGSTLQTKTRLKTNNNSRAHLIIQNGVELWLSGSTVIEVIKNKGPITRLKLITGKIKCSTPKLKRKNIFEIRTDKNSYIPKKSLFTLSLFEKKADLSVLFGEVKFKSKLGGKKTVTQGTVLTVNNTGKYNLGLLTDKQQVSGLSNWMAQANGKFDKYYVSRQRSKFYLRKFAVSSNRTERKILALTSRIKESDIETGRTLKDIHGNVVRVEQRVLRPEANTIQFVNIVKRPVYNHTRGNFTYNGGAIQNRIDSIEARVKFNINMPHNITNWYSFFSGNDVTAKQTTLTFASRISADEIFVTGFLNKNNRYDFGSDTVNTALENKLEDERKFYFGTVNKADYNKFTGFRVDIENGNLSDGTVKDINAETLSGLLWAEHPDAAGGWNELNPSSKDLRENLSRSGDNTLYKYEARPYCVGADCSVNQNKIWLAQEYYITDNSGRIRNSNDFTNSSDLFKSSQDTAFETVFYVKDNVLAYTNAGWYAVSSDDTNIQKGTSFTNPNFRNIDAVLIPDAAFSSIENIFSITSVLDND